MSTPIDPALDLSNFILDKLKERYGEEFGENEMELMRRGVGITLTALHSTMLYAPKDVREKRINVNRCLSSIVALVRSLNANMQELKLGNIEIGLDHKELH